MVYQENSKNWNTYKNYRNCPTGLTVMRPKYTEGMANSADPDQTASK